MAAMASTPFSLGGYGHLSQCVDPDMDAFVDFTGISSPSSSSQLHSLSRSNSAVPSPINGLIDVSDDFQTPAKPSHDYDQFKQQVGIPADSMATFRAMEQFSNGADAFGFDSYGFDDTAGLDLDSTDGAAMFYPTTDGPSPDSFVSPSLMAAHAAQAEQAPPIRYFPGVHQQQAALAKAQAEQQQQQQQQRRMLEQKHERNGSTSDASRTSSLKPVASHSVDSRSEETIARVISQIRRANVLPQSDTVLSSPPPLPHTFKSRKDEDDMDEDERLLASEEGKKLSSKERRQLRNKVSARAFRSRRKEYISQLESEVNMKNNENNELKRRNVELVAENVRSRNFIGLLLRHPAFQPFLDDLSRDPSLTESIASTGQPLPSSSAAKDINPAPFSSQMMPPPIAAPSAAAPPVSMADAASAPQIGIALVPDQTLDFGSLSINHHHHHHAPQQNWAAPSMGFNFHQPQVFAVLDVPEGPANPISTSELSGKGISSVFDYYTGSMDESKDDAPDVEELYAPEHIDARAHLANKAAAAAQAQAPFELDEADPLYPSLCLYVTSPASATATAQASDRTSDSPADAVSAAPSLDKTAVHFELQVMDKADPEALAAQFERRCAALEPLVARISRLTASFGF